MQWRPSENFKQKIICVAIREGMWNPSMAATGLYLLCFSNSSVSTSDLQTVRVREILLVMEHQQMLPGRVKYCGY